MRSRLLSVSGLLLGLLILASSLLAAALASEPLQAQSPKYPRINTATAYVVDPQWPKKPANMNKKINALALGILRLVPQIVQPAKDIV